MYPRDRSTKKRNAPNGLRIELVHLGAAVGGVCRAHGYLCQWSNPFGLSGKTWLFLILSGLATGASWVCYFRALKIGEASKVAPVDKLSVLLVAVFAVVFLGERPASREWVGILLVGAGVFVLAFKR
jgi:transporter family protein